MTTFVAVHGAFFGGWVWKPVAALLEAQGHRFLRPTLTGCAEREHVGGPQVNLATHIQDIVSLLEMEELEDVVLIGHSYAGLVIAGVAQHSHKRLSALVHLDALMPVDGECARDYMDPAMYAQAERLAAERGNGWRIPFFLPLNSFSTEDDRLRPWMISQLRGMPLYALPQPVSLPQDLSHIPLLFVYCKADALGLFETSRDRARNRPNTEVVELDTRHALMLTQPKVVADLLHSFSQHASDL